MSCRFFTKVRNEEGFDQFTLLTPLQMSQQNLGLRTPGGEMGHHTVN